MKEVIMVVNIDKRGSSAPAVQEILTRYGEMIRFRLGFHDLHQGAENGRILLQLVGEADALQACQQELAALDMVRVQAMELE